MTNDGWIERGRVGCDEAVGDGKSERCLMLAELELDTCWDRHPCSSSGATYKHRLGINIFWQSTPLNIKINL